MRKYDFLLVYETKNRELESICLLKYELERRGYSVAVVETWWTMQHNYRPISASVLVAFALYNDSQISYASSFGRDFKTIVNLQWEQIYTNSDEMRQDSHYRVSGCARNMVHIAWGPFTVNKLIDLCGVPEQNVKLTGHVAMDFIKPKLHGYYLERGELLRQYQISGETRLLLFISSFSYVSLPDVILNSEIYQKAALPVQDFKELSILSQAILFQWLREILPRHPECTFIYRPHPAEVDNMELKEMEREISNFRIIRDYSVKQWIAAADKVYTWYSTSAADAYFCGKCFDILRPVALPYEMELVLYNGGRFITTPQDFDRTIGGSDTGFPIKKEVLDSFYDFDEEVYAYSRICDALESAFHDHTDRCAQFRIRPKRSVVSRIIRFPLRIAKYWYLRLLGWMYEAGLFKQATGPLGEKAKYQAYVRGMIQNNYAPKREILMLQKRIQEIIIRNTQEEL